MKKILIIRFSSIGDIVLTTPVIRCVQEQLKAEVHVITRQVFAPVLNGNPHVGKVHTFIKDVHECFSALKEERFDHVIDLHNNLRSFRLKKYLGVPAVSFNKINIRKLAAVRLKMLDILPDIHIVHRYLAAAASLGVTDDGKGLDYFLSSEDTISLPDEPYVVIVLGGSYTTKKIPVKKIEEICKGIEKKIVLLGGKEEQEQGHQLVSRFVHLVNYCGKTSIGQSAFIISKSEFVITSDTGLMHIAAAFQKKIFSLWGNTVPEFGMYPYKPAKESQILEVKGLKCRPCSKLGYERCPKKHFKCMTEIDVSPIFVLR